MPKTWTELNAEVNRLTAELADMTSRYSRAAGDIASLEAELAEAREKYNAVIMEVLQKIPGEKRWETARRIIREHEEKYAPCQGVAAIDAGKVE